MSCQPNNTDPVYIEESKELGILRQTVIAVMLKGKHQIGHINMAFDLLKQCLYQLYSNTNISTLVAKSTLVSEANKFSKVAREAVALAQWSKSTSRTVLCTLKKVLEFTAISREFLFRITLRGQGHPYVLELGKKYGSLSPEDPVRKTLENWRDILKRHTRCKSKQSLRNIIRFILNSCLPAFNLSVYTLPIDTATHITKRIKPDVIEKICGMKSVSKKKKWLLVFLKHIMMYKFTVDDTWFDYANIEKVHGNPLEQDDGSDKHKIPTDELEKLYTACHDSVLDKLLFMLMLTTGLRIGGVVNIKLEHVAYINGKDVCVQDVGKTIEKGKKWATFILCDEVKVLIFKWLTCQRPAMESEYLFPGRNGQMSTSNARYRFGKIVKKAGLKGNHLHPHSLRHTFAHMMLKTGNTVDIVAKLLNHTNPKTTKQFYLKESAAEVAKRANIPWLNQNNIPKKPVIPNFLQKHQNTSEDANQNKKRRKAMASLEMFNKSMKT
jgi:integrase